MPSCPRPVCSVYRCKEQTRPGSSFCVDHAPPPPANQTKRETDREYKTAQWQTVRMRQLSIAPLCQACALSGRVTLGAHVDHVMPWKSLGPDGFANNVFQTLCGNCHSVKTGLEQRGIFRHYSNGGAVDYSPGDWTRLMADNPPQLGHWGD